MHVFLWICTRVINPSIITLPCINLLLVGSSGLEPPTSRLSGVRSNRLSYEPIPFGGDEEARTPDPLLAKQVLSLLSYTPIEPQKSDNTFMLNTSLHQSFDCG